MGCDIHLSAEHQTDDGVWHRVFPPPEHTGKDEWAVEQFRKAGGVWPPPGYDAATHVRGTPSFALAIAEADADKVRDFRYYGRDLRNEWFDTRHYETFAILANVRNCYHQSGDEGLPFIAEPRGLPADLSAELAAYDPTSSENTTDEEYEDRDAAYETDPDWTDFGDHSQSWVTLKELRDFNWDQERRRVGVIAWDAFAQRIRDGVTSSPNSYCVSIGGGGIETYTRAVAMAYLARGEKPKGRIHTCAKSGRSDCATSSVRTSSVLWTPCSSSIRSIRSGCGSSSVSTVESLTWKSSALVAPIPSSKRASEPTTTGSRSGNRRWPIRTTPSSGWM